ncbi:hypothetical protein [Polaribacter sp. M15]
MKKFILVDGYVYMNNHQLFLEINRFKNDLKSRGGWLGIFFALVGISVFHSIKTINYFKTFFDYFDLGLRILGLITIVFVFIYLIFFYKSKKKLLINEITKIKIEKILLETEVTIYFSKRRRLNLTFRNLENQLEPFIEEIKKRNSRITIKNI